jgi:hypothetical protein
MTAEVEVDGWTLGIIGGSWLYPDGDGYEPDDAGDVWVRSPTGLTAGIAWSQRDHRKFERLMGPRREGDFGVFEVWTQGDGPTSKASSARFLADFLPDLRQAADAIT